MKNFYKNKFTRIVYIYLLANLLFLIPQTLNNNYSLKEFLTILIWGKSQYHLWYLNLLLKFYLIFPLFKVIVQKLHSYLGAKSIFLITLIQYIISKNAYSTLYNSNNIIGQTIFKYLDRSLLIWMFYFILGALVYKNFDLVLNIINKYIKFFSIAFLAQIIYINLYTFNSLTPINVNYNRSSPSSFRVLILSVLAIIVLYYISNVIVSLNNNKLLKYIKFLSKYTLIIYIIHPIFVTLSNNIMDIQNYLPYNLTTFIITILVVLTSTLPIYLYDKFKKQKLFIKA